MVRTTHTHAHTRTHTHTHTHTHPAIPTAGALLHSPPLHHISKYSPAVSHKSVSALASAPPTNMGRGKGGTRKKCTHTKTHPLHSPQLRSSPRGVVDAGCTGDSQGDLSAHAGPSYSTFACPVDSEPWVFLMHRSLREHMMSEGNVPCGHGNAPACLPLNAFLATHTPLLCRVRAGFGGYSRTMGPQK